ncbi:Wide host range VirA protein [Botrimarina colliarenosi]|uniref:histidine kinase n=1 Tax=Botrimarina colliarenosi TaxID=2528001 RepID=A0A5C6AIX7_9BACT|nr:ATP-binding protein [Botrimarina colliarenosi]TWT99974.1 Wide host range VirA protein [Botrimarina colliarenosi]
MTPVDSSRNDNPTLEEENARLRRDLQAAQQMTALGELVSTTTHEFNNVLTTILNYAKLGLRHTDEATRTRSLEKILSAGQRAEKLTSSVLGLARNRSADPAPTDLGALCDETLVLLERELQKYRVGVDRQYEAKGQAMVVGNQVQQVLMNLLTNARQAMPSGGQVVIRTADNAAGTVDLSVRDTGAGIAMEMLPRIFDRGFSTKSGPDETGKGGAGLGLSACREMIEAQGGKIRVESAVGRGTQFTLRLPAASAAALAGPAGQPIAKLGVTDAESRSAAAI